MTENTMEKLLRWIDEQQDAWDTARANSTDQFTWALENKIEALELVKEVINRSHMVMEENEAVKRLQPTFGEVQGVEENQRYDVYISSGGNGALHPRIASEVEQALAALPIKPQRLFVVNGVITKPIKLNWDDV